MRILSLIPRAKFGFLLDVLDSPIDTLIGWILYTFRVQSKDCINPEIDKKRRSKIDLDIHNSKDLSSDQIRWIASNSWARFG